MTSELPREALQTTDLIVEKHPPSRGDGSFLAKDPSDGGAWNLRVTPKFLERCRRVSESELKTLAYTVPSTCADPTIIYQGIRQEDEQEWLCYVGMPLSRFSSTGRKESTDENDIFLVFVNAERRVYGFAWERSATPNSGIPRDERTRFDRRVYP